MRLSIIIPVFNEEKTIVEVIRKTTALPLKDINKEIIIIDDGSTDNTVQHIHRYIKQIKSDKNTNIILLEHNKNQGKGAAIRTGLEKAHGEFIIIQDADLEYDPIFIQKLLDPIMNKQAEVVYGTRLNRFPNLLKDEKTPLFLLHYCGNRLLSIIASILYGQWLTDMETCYKIFPKSALAKFKLQANSFDFEPEITAKLLKAGYKILEISIKTTPRGYEEGKKLHTIRDGSIALWTLLKYRLIN